MRISSLFARVDHSGGGSPGPGALAPRTRLPRDQRRLGVAAHGSGHREEPAGWSAPSGIGYLDQIPRTRYTWSLLRRISACAARRPPVRWGRTAGLRRAKPNEPEKSVGINELAISSPCESRSLFEEGLTLGV